MANHDPFLLEKQRDCERLFRKYNGRCHGMIEYEMRQLGWTTFHRRFLYSRGPKPGWIKALNWERSTNLTSPANKVWPGLSFSSTNNDQRSTSHDQPSTLSRFRTWLRLNWPNMDWDAKHLQLLCDKLEQVGRGERPRLIIQMPPRHGKSELVTVRYPAFRLRCDPSENIIIASYGQKLANRFSRKIRRALADDFANQRAGNAGALACQAANAADLSLKGTQTIAQGKAEGRDPGFVCETRTDPEGVERSMGEAAPLQGANDSRSFPGVPPKRLHPRLLSSSPSATGDPDFPFINPRPKNSEAEWETSKGGGLRAVGVGGGVTGFGANLIVVDDPIKSRAEAESPTARERVWEWFNDDIYTRLEPNGAIIVVQTRWHEDDLAGRLIQQMKDGGEHWDVISLPAIAEAEPPALAGGDEDTEAEIRGGADTADWTASVPACQAANAADGAAVETTSADPTPHRPHAGGTGVGKRDACGPVDWRQPGEALWPARYPIARLETIRKQIGTYSFEGLFQQRPIPADGGMFKREWFRKIIAAPPPNLRWTRGYDLGVTAKPGSDHTASFRVAFDRDGNMYIDGGFRARIEYPAQRRYILGRIAAERDTEHGVEATHNGEAIVQDLKRERGTFGRSLRAIPVKEPKTARVIPWTSLAESGCVYLIRGGWNQDFIDEACSFPSGTFDDQIDAVSLAVKMHRRKERSFHTF